jgi:hypothetical protein
LIQQNPEQVESGSWGVVTLWVLRGCALQPLPAEGALQSVAFGPDLAGGNGSSPDPLKPPAEASGVHLHQWALGNAKNLVLESSPEPYRGEQHSGQMPNLTECVYRVSSTVHARCYITEEAISPYKGPRVLKV